MLHRSGVRTRQRLTSCGSGGCEEAGAAMFCLEILGQSTGFKARPGIAMCEENLKFSLDWVQSETLTQRFRYFLNCVKDPLAGRLDLWREL